MASAGCSIVPVPQDVLPIDTYGIVAQFRCEMRDVLKTRVINSLEKRPDTAHLAQSLKDGTLPFANLISKIQNKDVKGVFEQYAGATILYDFSLNMTEINNVSGGIALTRPLTRGSDAIGITLASDHKRQNTRTFTIDDSFEKLLTYLPADYCKNTVSEPNYNYPIAGRTRLEDTVLTFLDLNQSGNLGTKPAGPKTPTLTDDLQFTTKYSGNLSPGFTSIPFDKILQLTGANGKLDSSREDLHRVTIVLSLPPVGYKPTPLTIAESRAQAELALLNSNRNRTEIAIQSISGNLANAIR